jgi:hypothetical protein
MTLFLALVAICLASPLIADWYLRHLPVAPACPSCRWVAKQAAVQPTFPGVIPSFARTFLAECGRCGWRGRMRWTLARSTAGTHRLT